MYSSYRESRYVIMIAIKFSIDMILSRIGSLTGAPTVQSITVYRAKCVKTCFSAITFDLLIHLQSIHYRHRCKILTAAPTVESIYVRMIAIKFSIDIILS
uniref:Secreted protein n=1 Tax=Heterorhabditis bacteriophora TaxID=37862 RepID=A0A1I7WDD4_HETBA